MRLDPQTTVGSLLRAVPSSATIFERFGIEADPSEEKTLEQVCTGRNVRIQEFLQAMDEVDWNKESPENSRSEGDIPSPRFFNSLSAATFTPS